MKNIWLSIGSCLPGIAAFLALAGTAHGMPTPSEVLSRAREGRAAYIQVLGEVEAEAPAVAAKAALYSYINALDELQVIGAGYELDSVGAGPLPNAALALTRAAIKFARIGDDSVLQLTTVLRWAEDDVRFEVAQAQRAYLTRAEGASVILRWHFDTGLLLDALAALHAAAYVTTSFEDIQATTATKLVGQLDQLSQQDVLRILRSLRAVAGFEAFLSEIERRVLASNDDAFLKQALGWTLAGHAQLRLLPSVPQSTARLPGDMAREGVAKLLQADDTPDPAIAAQLVALMSETQLIEYLQALQLVLRDRIGQTAVEFLFLTLRDLAGRLEAAGLVNELATTQTLFSRVTMMRASSTNSYEGVFTVQVGDTPGTLTIADMGDSNFILCLSLNYGGTPVYYSFFHTAYNFRDESWEAHRFAVDDPRYVMPNWPVWYLKFKLVIANGHVGIEGTFSDSRRFLPLQGARTALFNRQWGAETALVDNLSGTYATASGVDGAPDFLLNVTQVGFKLAGTLRLGAGAAKVDFVYGYLNRERSLFRITSAELANGRWVQIRGQVVGNRLLSLDYLIGGAGARFERLSLQELAK